MKTIEKLKPYIIPILFTICVAVGIGLTINAIANAIEPVVDFSKEVAPLIIKKLS